VHWHRYCDGDCWSIFSLRRSDLERFLFSLVVMLKIFIVHFHTFRLIYELSWGYIYCLSVFWSPVHQPWWQSSGTCLSIFPWKTEKLLIRNHCNFVGICVMELCKSGTFCLLAYPRSSCILVTFDLDLWPWELKLMTECRVSTTGPSLPENDVSVAYHCKWRNVYFELSQTQ